ncbi:MAG: hypothetical protein V4812_01430, partial [Pseudomonadota bacterium]
HGDNLGSVAAVRHIRDAFTAQRSS